MWRKKKENMILNNNTSLKCFDNVIIPLNMLEKFDILDG